jgi:DNA repair protein RecO (recombination protein O)
MLHRTEGIVLKTAPFGEADLIVTYLTGDRGIVNAFAKSPRKVKSRFGSSLEPLTQAKISFWGKEDASLPRLTQSDIIYPFDSIRSTLKSFLKASELIELTINFLAERDAGGKVYPLLIDTLHEMERGRETEILLVYYKLRFLDMVGYLPGLDNCGRCGGKGNAFFLSHGTVLCERCSKGGGLSFRLSPGVINLSAVLLGWSLPKLKRIKPSERLVSELSKVLDEHAKYIAQKNFRSQAFRVS